MAIIVDSAVAFALEQPGVKTACLVTLNTASGDVLRLAVDSVTWSGITFQARLRPSCPEPIGSGIISLAGAEMDSAIEASS